MTIDYLTNSVFRKFKRYRRKQGGTWYKVFYQDPKLSQFVQGDNIQWQRETPAKSPSIRLLEVEHYPDKFESSDTFLERMW